MVLHMKEARKAEALHSAGRPTRGELISRISAEHDFTKNEAEQFVLFLERITAGCQTDSLCEHLLTWDEWNSIVHDILDAVVPDETISEAGTIHSALELYLAPSGGVLMLGHTKTELYNEGDNCVVTLTTVSAVLH